MTTCTCHDAAVFGHTMCDRRPPHMASEQAAQRHYEADTARRNSWAQVAHAALAEVRRRGAVAGVTR